MAGFVDAIPHNHALGVKLLEMQRAEARFLLPYKVELVGNPDTGVLHGGAITALLDACSGAAVFAALTEWKPIATLDLRIDYMRAGEVGRDIICRAHCYKLARNVAFTRAVAEFMVRTFGDRFTATVSKARRKGKIFIDYLRNAQGATAIAPYAVRASRSTNCSR